MFISDTITYSGNDADGPILMVPASVADSVARHLIAVGVSCALPGEDRIDGTSEPLCLLSVASYSPVLQSALEAWLANGGFSFERVPEQPDASPPSVDWKYTNR